MVLDVRDDRSPLGGGRRRQQWTSCQPACPCALPAGLLLWNEPSSSGGLLVLYVLETSGRMLPAWQVHLKGPAAVMAAGMAQHWDDQVPKGSCTAVAGVRLWLLRSLAVAGLSLCSLHERLCCVRVNLIVNGLLGCDSLAPWRRRGGSEGRDTHTSSYPIVADQHDRWPDPAADRQNNRC